VIAGSSRNEPQFSLGGGRQERRATDWEAKEGNLQLSYQTPNLLSP
jgi:hypothetical protein